MPRRLLAAVLSVALVAPQAALASPQDVSSVCAQDQDACGIARQLEAGIEGMTAQAEPDPALARSLNQRIVDLYSRIDAVARQRGLQPDAKTALRRPAYNLDLEMSKLNLRVGHTAVPRLDADLDAVRDRLAAVDKRLSAGAAADTQAAELRAIGQRLDELQSRAVAIRRDIAFSQNPVITKGEGEQRTRTLAEAGQLAAPMNAAEARLAALADALRSHGPAGAPASGSAGVSADAIGERLRRGGSLAARFASPGDPGAVGGPVMTPERPLKADPVLAAPRRGPSDLSGPPTPAPAQAPLKPDDPDSKYDSNPYATLAAKAQRWLGLTRTVGNPQERAQYAFKQRGETCGVAVQVEFMAEKGEVARDQASLHAAEDALYQRAVREGLFAGDSADPQLRDHGSTPNRYVGELLRQPIAKHYLASDEDLTNAVKSGRLVAVGVRSGELWNDPRFAKDGHFVTITGAEVSRVTGNVVGFYINDTGTGSAARFVSAEQLFTAWHDHQRFFVEQLK